MRTKEPKSSLTYLPLGLQKGLFKNYHATSTATCLRKGTTTVTYEAVLNGFAFPFRMQ